MKHPNVKLMLHNISYGILFYYAYCMLLLLIGKLKHFGSFDIFVRHCEIFFHYEIEIRFKFKEAMGGEATNKELAGSSS